MVMELMMLKLFLIAMICGAVGIWMIIKGDE